MKNVFESFFNEAKKFGAQTIDEYTQESKYSISRGIRYWGGNKVIRDNLVNKYKEKYPEFSFYIRPDEKGWVSVGVCK